MNCCVFDIQRFSVHDGPGIRTNIFLKGCGLRCLWCCNPESQEKQPVLLFDPELCIGCGNCVATCPTGAAAIVNGQLIMERGKCTGCGRCVDGCYADARSIKGVTMTAETVMEEILKDQAFYRNSRGGVTFSGGEPLLHPEFVREIMEKCHARGIHTAVETCGFVPWESFETVLPYTDLFLYDVKHVGSDKHRAYTGQGNELILRNLYQLSRRGAEIVIRVPVIPTFNMDRETLGQIIALAESLNVQRIDLLPYHRYASGKYRLLGRTYWSPGVEKADVEEIAEIVRTLPAANVKITVGG